MSAPTEAAVLSVDRLSKRYCTDLKSGLNYGTRALVEELRLRHVEHRPELRRHEFWALDDVSFDLRPGEALGIIGANGAGKTTLLRILHGLTKPDFGEVRIQGRSGALIELGNSFDLLATGREAIATEAAVLGLPAEARSDTFRRIVEFAEIGEFIDAPVRTYSTGMRMRLGYAVAAEMDPALLLIDEVLAVGDIGFQRKCIRFVQGYLGRGGTLVLVSHDLFMIRSMCTRCVVLEHGSILADADVDDAIQTYTASADALASASTSANAELAPRLRSRGRRGRALRDDPDLDDTTEDELTDAFAPDLSGGEHSDLAVSAARLRGEDGADPMPRHPATLEVDLEVRTDLGPAIWGFSIAPPGQPVPLVRAESPRDQPLRLPVGRHRLTARIPQLPVLSGRYHLRISVFDATTDEMVGQRGWLDQPLDIAVSDRAGERQSLEKVAGVLSVMDGTWTVSV